MFVGLFWAAKRAIYNNLNKFGKCQNKENIFLHLYKYEATIQANFMKDVGLGILFQEKYFSTGTLFVGTIFFLETFFVGTLCEGICFCWFFMWVINHYEIVVVEMIFGRFLDGRMILVGYTLWIEKELFYFIDTYDG